MTRRMLINAHNPEELRIAVVDDKKLENYQVEVAEQGLTRGNIYRGVIASIQPSLNAAFIEYGGPRNGFLPIQDVVPDAYYRQPKNNGSRPKIDEVLDKGRPIVVQVNREPEDQKGAALTTNLSLAGRYLVLTPFDDTRGVSRKVEDDGDRKALKKMTTKLKLPEGCGVIVRTNAVGQTQTTLNRDLAALVRLWKRIQGDARKGGKGSRAKLLYSDQDLLLQALRDHFDSSIEEILVDEDEAHERCQEYMKAFMPRGKTRLVRYDERTPLFSKFEIERQIDRIYDRSVDLPSGGSIVIDRTEALTAIDVNSGKANKAATQEDTAVQTNCEAAKEVARQLRLRDLGGLVVVDFIDMRSRKNQRRVEKNLRDALKVDRARATASRISQNGLVEINRQRIQQALSLRTHRACPTCAGTGRIASPEMVGLNLLRRIAGRAASGPLSRARISLHPELADAFQNGRRKELAQLEEEFSIHVEVVAAPHLHRSDQEVEWFQREKVEEMASQGQPPRRRNDAASIRASILSMPTPAEAADSDEDENEDEPQRRGRSRRRGSRGSRGGRRRSGRSGGDESRDGQAAQGSDSREDDTSESRRSDSRRSRSRQDDAEKTASRNADSRREDASNGDEDRDSGSGTRRRRSSRRRGRSSQDEAREASTPSRKATESAKSTDDEPLKSRRSAADAKGDEGNESGERRSPRRRSRRSTAGDGDGDTGSRRSERATAKSDEPSEAKARERSEPRRATPRDDDGDDHPTPRRRRSSRRRSSSDSSDDSSTGNGSTGKSARGSSSKSDDGAEATPPRRRRSRSASSSSDDDSSRASASNGSNGSGGSGGSRGSRGSSASDASSEDPAPRRRRRRRSGSDSGADA